MAFLPPKSGHKESAIIAQNLPFHIIHFPMQASKTELQISIYSNPAKDFVFVKSEKQITKIELYDYSGKKLKESASKEMNISSLQRGNYFIKITDKEGNTQTKNLIKE
jgi:hypothetical protein